ncbi:MAG TPA: protein phosphatase 2C domain-containing protein [Oligoflexia bacterium]|nr:protein phosphatase 2C domain-containing protein [Oligoflexia bacterium]HMP47078.1 protein phosphatase 2C domain-containing protein [Oligoflexia bacterium]
MEQDQLDMERALSSSQENLPAAVSDIGCEREINEDRYAGFKVDGGYVWIVCDGMGGAVGGELAAQLALDTIKRALEGCVGDLGIEHLVEAIQEANRVIVLRRQNPLFSGMGTTIVAALVTDYGVYIAHAGDSRAYVVSGRRIEQLTTDHTYVQELVDKGMITEEDAMNHPQSHVLTRCLGGEPRVRADKNVYGLNSSQDGESETLVLCSDGLYSLVADHEIYEMISSMNPQSACSAMVELARSRGGFDNITVAVIPLAGVMHGDPVIPAKGGVLGRKPAISSATNSRSSKVQKRKPLSRAQVAVLVIMLAVFSVTITLILFFALF